MAGRRSICRCV
jgi:Endodeoxyribonuclease RusA